MAAFHCTPTMCQASSHPCHRSIIISILHGSRLRIKEVPWPVWLGWALSHAQQGC